MKRTISQLSIAAVALLILYGTVAVHSGSNPATSQCIRCHTDVKGLIRLGWEVAASRPASPISPETEGEG